MNRILVAGLTGLLIIGLGGCGEQGSAEKAGKAVDEAVEDVSSGAEGALESLGREVDEAAKETKEAVDEMGDVVDPD